jgi:hypothetical protein
VSESVDEFESARENFDEDVLPQLSSPSSAAARSHDLLPQPLQNQQHGVATSSVVSEDFVDISMEQSVDSSEVGM